MNRLRMLVTWCVCSTLACIELPEIVDPPVEVPLEVRLTSPGDRLHTNGDVPVQVVVEGGEAEGVELLLGEELLVRLSPPYSYTWPTQGVAEGEYRLTARAFRNGEFFTSPASTVVVDRTPPQVVSRTPAPGAQDVSVRAPIRIEFSEPLLRSSVTDASFSVTVGGTVTGHTMQLSEDAQSVELSLAQPPSVPAELAVMVSAQLTDGAGNVALATVGSWAWHAPAFLPFAPSISASGGLTANSSLSIAADTTSSGLVMAWTEAPGSGARDVFVRRWDGTTWSEVSGLPPLSRHRSKPYVLVRSSGQPVMAFLEDGEDSVPKVVVAELSGASWAPLGEASRCKSALGAVRTLLMALGPDQQPVIALSDFNNDAPDEGRVFVCRFQHGAWEVVGTPLGLSGVTGNADLWGLEVDSSGTPMVLWSEDGVFSIAQWDGTRWARRGQTILAGTGAVVLGASLSMGREGVPYAVWMVRNADGSKWLHAARDTFAGLLGSALITRDAQSYPGPPSVVMDGHDRPIAFWSEQDATNRRVALRMKRWLGVQWDETLEVSSIAPQAGSGACMTDTQDAVLCAHPEYDGQRNVVSLKRFNQ